MHVLTYLKVTFIILTIICFCILDNLSYDNIYFLIISKL